MPESRYPRLSQARGLLVLLRAHLGRAAFHYSLPANLTLDLLPIVEDGLFGYEILPDLDTRTYLTIGVDANDAPVMRKCLYCATSPSALRVATIDGRTLSQQQLDAWSGIEQRDTAYDDWAAAAAATWAALASVFPDRPRHPIRIHDTAHSAFDETLATTQACLGDCDPWIDFCGIPDEAQYGFVLKGDRGEHGHLILRSRGSWELRWVTLRAAVVIEEWPAIPPFDASGIWASAGEPAGGGVHPTPFAGRDDLSLRPRGRR
ncbi:MAG: hypothetical protein ABI724_18210 [Betaproteobacteria bacterium]